MVSENRANAQKELDYEFLSTSSFVMVALEQRTGRMPIQKAEVTPYGELKLYCKDGIVEVLGRSDNPCPLAMIERATKHHDGLLLVEFDNRSAMQAMSKIAHAQGAEKLGMPPAPVAEQLIKAPLFTRS